jgi:multiple sugar transport system substrate-binding protein
MFQRIVRRTRFIPILALLMLLAQQITVAQEPITIRFASFQSGAVVETWEQQFAEFEAETGIRVVHEYIPADETVERYLTLAASNDLPDVAMLSARFLRAIAARGLLAGLTQDQFTTLDLNDFWGNLLMAYNYDDVQYGLPTDLDLQLVYYNKTLFDDTGVSYPQAGWTWDDFRETARQLSSGEGTDRTYGSLSLEFGQARMVAWSYGGDFIDVETLQPTWDGEAARQALSLIYGMTVEDGSMPVSGTEGVGMDNGRAGMAIYGPWGAWYIMNGVDYEWDVAPVPRGTEDSVLAWGSALGMFQSTEHPEAVAQFMEFFLSPERQYQRAADWAWFPSRQSVTEIEGFMDESVLALTAEQKQYIIDSTAYGRAPFVHPDEAQLEDIYYQEVGLMSSGTQSLDDTLTNLQREWTDVLN